MPRSELPKIVKLNPRQLTRKQAAKVDQLSEIGPLATDGDNLTVSIRRRKPGRLAHILRDVILSLTTIIDRPNVSAVQSVVPIARADDPKPVLFSPGFEVE